MWNVYSLFQRRIAQIERDIDIDDKVYPLSCSKDIIDYYMLCKKYNLQLTKRATGQSFYNMIYETAKNMDRLDTLHSSFDTEVNCESVRKANTWLRTQLSDTYK
jgi:hypothetical protein